MNSFATLCVSCVTLLSWAEPYAPPSLTTGMPAAGRFVKVVAPEYSGTGVYHGLYLPLNWQRDGKYPVIVEYAPNESPGHGTTGRVDDCRLGYGVSRDLGCIWLVLPYVNEQEKRNQSTWWGDLEATVRYLKLNLPRTLEQYGGDPQRVVLCGFSRGSIACGYVGLYDDESAKLWRGMIAFSHFDGGRFTPNGAEQRLPRFAGRRVLIAYGENDGGRSDNVKQAELLRKNNWAEVTELMVAGFGHSDAWSVTETPARQQAIAWLKQTLE